MLLLCRQQSRFRVLQQVTSKLGWMVFVLPHVCGVFFSHADLHSVVCWLQFLMTTLISMLAHLHGSFVWFVCREHGVANCPRLST
jgi:hypothetical protein